LGIALTFRMSDKASSSEHSEEKHEKQNSEDNLTDSGPKSYTIPNDADIIMQQEWVF
jgi:hypothetical protein